jgi:hypothetical protein
MPAQILDQWGKPAVYTGWSSASSGLYPERDPRTSPKQPEMFGDFSALLPRYAWRRAVSDCRWIASSFPLVAGASEQMADYVSASKWHTYFTGKNQEWGDIAEAKVQEVDQICTSRSPLFDWASLWWAGVTACNADGGYFVYFGSSEDGFPVLQPFEAHRIGSWDTAESTVDKGGYAGARIMNGIIYDRKGQEVAYRLLGEESGQFQDISARDMMHVQGRSRYYSQGRPLPRIATALRDLYMVQNTREAETISQNVNSRLVVKESNESGKRPTAAEMGNPLKKTENGTATEMVEMGYWRYLKNGGKLEVHESNRPSDQWSRFDDKITATALFGMGWRIEMFDLSKLTSGAIHGFADQINTTIGETFGSFVRYVKRARGYMIAKLIQRGDLPENDEWYKWQVQEPADFTPNPSRAMKSDLEAVRGGAQSMTELHRRYGKRPRDVLAEQAKYLQTRAEIAKEYGVDEDDLGRTDMPGDNTQQPAGPANGSAKTEEGDE